MVNSIKQDAGSRKLGGRKYVFSPKYLIVPVRYRTNIFKKKEKICDRNIHLSFGVLIFFHKDI